VEVIFECFYRIVLSNIVLWKARETSLSLSLSLSLFSSSSGPAALARALVKSSINKISRQLNERHNDVGASGRDGGA